MTTHFERPRIGVIIEKPLRDQLISTADRRRLDTLGEDELCPYQADKATIVPPLCNRFQ